jgi:regulator of sirC expression with transglutaminase-like and TPR domain
MADLTRLSLEIAADARPDLDTAYYLDAIDALALRVADRCPRRPNARQVLQQINWVLFIEDEYRANVDEYYDPRNSYLDQVIERRLGIPISLSILYRGVAERLGIALAGVNLPAHFLLRLPPGAAEPMFIDAYHGGQTLTREGCVARVEEVTGQRVELPSELFEPCSTRAIVVRMLRNLKVALLSEADYHAAWPVQQRLAALLPENPVEARDLGLIALRTERPGTAMDGLDAYLSAHPEAPDAGSIQALLKQAKAEVACRN